MIIFCFLGVGPPCCSILCQFWLCEEAQCVYLRRHLGSDGVSFHVLLCYLYIFFGQMSVKMFSLFFFSTELFFSYC